MPKAKIGAGRASVLHLPKDPTPAHMARFAAQLTEAEAARRLYISVSYLRQMERRGGYPFVLAERAARLCGCPIETFACKYQSTPTISTTTKGGTKEAATGQKKKKDLGSVRSAGTPSSLRTRALKSSEEKGEKNAS